MREMVQDIPTETAVGRAVARLKENIRVGRFTPGQRLPEPALVELLGISRGPIREALRLLEAEGLVDIAPHRGASVHRVSREEIAQVGHVRGLLAAESARLAAEAIDRPGAAARLRAELERQRQLRGDPDLAAYANANVRFHALIDALAGNAILADTLERLQTKAGLFFGLALPGSKDALLEEHMEIGDAILAGDAALAGRRARRHVEAARRATLALPDHWFE